MASLTSLQHRTTLALCILCLTLLTACGGMRSISDSGYHDDRGGGTSSNPYYKGELSELDVLGIDLSRAITEQEIASTLDASKRFSLRKGSAVLLIQSGAPMPDEGMSQVLEKYFNVGVFSGVPLTTEGAASMEKGRYSHTLRLAAAQGGYQSIICYWGVLEAAQKGLATKSVSWVPVVGWVLPDETQDMRIRLKVALIDVRSGTWSIFSPAGHQDQSSSGTFSRAGVDQAQVAKLKAQAYQEAAEELVKRYTD